MSGTSIIAKISMSLRGAQWLIWIGNEGSLYILKAIKNATGASIVLLI